MTQLDAADGECGKAHVIDSLKLRTRSRTLDGDGVALNLAC